MSKATARLFNFVRPADSMDIESFSELNLLDASELEDLRTPVDELKEEIEIKLQTYKQAHKRHEEMAETNKRKAREYAEMIRTMEGAAERLKRSFPDQKHDSI